jgi:glutathione reductase (NADPH)
VPKKITYNAAEFVEHLDVMRSYSINAPEFKLNLKEFKRKRDSEIERLNGAYHNLLHNSGVNDLKGSAKFVSDHVIECDGV